MASGENHKFAQSWVLPTFLIIGLCLFGVVGLQIYQSYSMLMTDAKQTLWNYSLATNDAIGSSLQSLDVALRKTAIEIAEKKAWQKDFTAIDTRLLQMEKAEIPTTDFLLLDSKLNIYHLDFKTGKFVDVHVNNSDREWARQVRDQKEDKLVVSAPLFGKIVKQELVVAARRITGANGEFLGAVYCSLGDGFFTSLRHKFKIDPHDLFAVMTGDPPQFLYRTPQVEGLVGKPLAATPETAPVINRKLPAGVFETHTKSDHIHRLIAISWVGPYPILVSIGRDFDSIIATWRTQALTTAGVTFAFLIFALFLLLRFVQLNHRAREYQANMVYSTKLASLGEMAGSMAHEINNPLMIISGHVQKLERALQHEKLDKQMLSTSLIRIRTTVDRIAKIISGLRVFAKNEDDSRADVVLGLILHQALALCQERFRASGIELLVETGADEILLHVNETQFLQVLINLLNNSFDAVSALPHKWIRIQVAFQAQTLSLSITDSGHGIKGAVASRLMEPFFTTKEIGQGTGLGLSVSRRIIELHGGKLFYDSKSLHTRFVIELPARCQARLIAS